GGRSRASLPVRNSLHAKPSPRAFHGAAICQDFLVIFGGATDARLRNATNDLYLLDLNHFIWYACPSSSSSSDEKRIKRRSEEGADVDAKPTCEEESEDSVVECTDTSASSLRELFTVCGGVPSPRVGLGMCTVKHTQQIFLFGGAEGDNTLYCLEMEVKRRSEEDESSHDEEEEEKEEAKRRRREKQINSPRKDADDMSDEDEDEEEEEVENIKVTWTRVQTRHTGPVSRGFFSLLQVGVHPHSNSSYSTQQQQPQAQLFVFGGLPLVNGHSNAMPADLYVLNLKTHTWNKPLYEGRLCLRGEASAVLHDKLIVFGGARTDLLLRPSSSASHPKSDSSSSSSPSKFDIQGGESQELKGPVCTPEEGDKKETRATATSTTFRSSTSSEAPPPPPPPPPSAPPLDQNNKSTSSSSSHSSSSHSQNPKSSSSSSSFLLPSGESALSGSVERGEYVCRCQLSSKLFFLNVLEIKDQGGATTAAAAASSTSGGSSSSFRFKLVTIGDSGVGKSCLLMRFVQDEYSDFQVSTIGVDFKAVQTMVKGRVCTLQLWDTAGQERFSGVTGNYYRNADGFILVFDMSKRASFLHIHHWLE
ncbi:ras family, partial [Cystoisospora suis]